MARIPAEVITTALEGAGSPDHEAFDYTSAVFTQMAQNPHYDALRGYLLEAESLQENFEFPYKFAAAISCNVMTHFAASQGSKIDFTQDEIAAHRAIADSIFDDPRWEDEVWVLNRLASHEGVDADSGIGYFLNLLDQVAPELAAAVATFTAHVEPASQRAVFRGFYDGFMPFYTHLAKVSEGSA